MNKKSEAIKILKKQIDKIHGDQFIRENNWVQETNTYLKKFFGPDSDQSKKFDKNAWDYENGMGQPNEIVRINIATDFLQDCIFQINNFGLYKEPNKGNYFTNLGDKMITFWLGVVFGGGILIGRMVYRVFECNQ